MSLNNKHPKNNWE